MLTEGTLSATYGVPVRVYHFDGRHIILLSEDPASDNLMGLQ
jgi:hypothetical protein